MNRQAPYVAAIHDLSGVGRCALTIVLPVLSAMGCQCAPLPTAYLSASTIYPPSDHFVFRDLTGEMEGLISALTPFTAVLLAPCGSWEWCRIS